ncbi:hypothetical protein I5G59_gp97 [Mycobacterium phage LilMcDreamy]|uniref:Uncharacterized protein n=1 Tax=Mycobacterium phage LilMcDreamy TaxID=2652422 RepID=A0A5P8D6R2_9CAUD|nr:hypothetical protein I5G59_gp97 [Mycobacterium phage LilMcDreamy]QFP94717.1 hypothetical protein SEA_LILMCDREAMY_97 [Mycobacterium phage LilMcDreamy]
MKWTREGSGGAYVAGPYRIEHAEGEWTLTGPDGLDTARPTKAEVQRLAYEYASARVAGDGAYKAPAVVGDWAYVGGFCRITAVLTDAKGDPLYVLLTSRKKRRCLSRYEFPLVVR